MLVPLHQVNYVITNRPPAAASTIASSRRRSRSGIRGASALPSAMPGSEPTSKEASARYEKSMANAKVRQKAEASVSNPVAIDRDESPRGTVTN